MARPTGEPADRRDARPKPGPASLVVAAALVLGACAVDVNGAPCSTPGDPGTCPSGQACGNDHRCSERAFACWKSGSWCTPGVGGACLDPEGNSTAGPIANARRCTPDDPVCGTWILDPCADRSLACAMRAPAGADVGAWCVCPDQAVGSRELFVRREGSVTGSAPFPTGAASPAACGYRRISDALRAATDVAADPSAVATVTVLGAGTDPGTAGTVTFSGTGANAETFPLVVTDRVTLRSDVQTGGGTYQIVFDGDGLPSAPVVLHSGGALAGFTVRNGSGDAARGQDAVALSCDGPDPALLTSVVLDGAGAGGSRLGRGIAAGAGCSAVARDVTVRNMTGAGFWVDAGAPDPAPAVTVSVSGGTIAGCGEGVFVRFGHVVLQSVRIQGNAGMGVRANDDLSGNPRVEIRDSKVVGNGDTGVALGNASEVRITGTTSSGNGAATSWGGLPRYSASRKGGGIVLVGNPPSGAVEFARNRIYGNGGDQVLVVGAATTWNLDEPSSCSSDPSGPLYSMIGCYDPTPAGTTLSYRGIVAVNANVSAHYWGWQTVTPTANEVGAFSGTVTSPLPTFFCPGDANLCAEPP